MIVLRHGTFISNGKIFRAGSVIPDSNEARKLVEHGNAEIISNKTAKKAKAEAPREDVKGDS